VTDPNHPTSSQPNPQATGSSGSEYQDILSGVIKDQQDRREAAAATAKRQRAQKRGRGNQPLMLGILALVSGYLWFGQPAFLEPKPLDPVSAELAEAGLRFEMSIIIGNITQYASENGRLPTTLADAYEARPGFQYQAQGDGFSLSGTEGELSLQYESSQDVMNFLGNAIDVVRGGGAE
jgi:hypothetical protein